MNAQKVPAAPTQASAPSAFAGVDVSKATLDAHVRSGDGRGDGREDASGFALPNDEAGIAELAERLLQARPKLVVMEATGGYERRAALTLVRARLAVAVVNPSAYPRQVVGDEIR